MESILTFLDAGVLIAAARGTNEVAKTAMSILDDPKRKFVSSDFVRLEVLPKAIYHKHQEEKQFYLEFFKHISKWVNASRKIVLLAEKEACQTGLSALDALHIATAKIAKAKQFVTAEKPTKPLFRVKNLEVISIQSLSTD